MILSSPCRFLLSLIAILFLIVSPAALSAPPPEPKGGAQDALVFSTFLGGEGADQFVGMTTDQEGNIYICGWSSSPNFTATPGAYDTEPNGSYDVFVAKISSDGSDLVALTFLGGEGDDRPHAMAIGGDGRIYVAGHTGSLEFPTTEGAFSREQMGDNDGFVARFDPTLSTLEFSTFLGGSDADDILALAVAPGGEVIAGGRTASPDFPTTPGAFEPSWNSDPSDVDAFVTRIAADGKSLVYSTFVGGSAEEGVNGIDTDGEGNAYAVGQTASADFPVTEGAYDREYAGAIDAFMIKINPSGSDLVYATYLGGIGEDWGNAVDLNAAGEAYMAGYTRSMDYPVTTRAVDTTFNGNTDGFVTKLRPDGSALSYSTYIGGIQGDNITSIVVAGNGSAFLAGGTYSADFPVNGYDRSYNGDADGFVMKITPNGRDALYGTFLGGTDEDYIYGMRIDPSGTFAYVGGTTKSPEFPVTPGAWDESHNGFTDLFMTMTEVPDPSLDAPEEPERPALRRSTVRPNPVSGEARIHIAPGEETGARITLHLFNALGETIGREEIDWNGGEIIFTLKGADLPAGVYHYRALSGDRAIAEGAFIVE